MATKKKTNSDYRPDKYNTSVQYYKGIPVRLILYKEGHFANLRAKRYMLGEPPHNHRQNIWIPNAYLEADGTLKDWNMDFIFKRAAAQHKLEYAGIHIDPFQW